MQHTPSKIDIYGHRGAAGLSPENTLPAYRTALQIGVDALDLDVMLTQDQVVILAHDPLLNPAFTRDQHGHWLQQPGPAILDLHAKDIQQYDVGRLNQDHFYAARFPLQYAVDQTAMPTLAELIQMVEACGAHHIRYQIEIKTDPSAPEHTPEPAHIVPAIIAVLRAAGVSAKAEIHSFDWRNLLLLKTLAPEVVRGFISEQRTTFNNINPQPGTASWTADHHIADYDHSVPKMIHALGGQIWCPHYTELNAAQVAEAQALHIKVHPWTVDSELAMLAMIKMHVDGIITNRPDRLRGLLIARGFQVPAPVACPC